MPSIVFSSRFSVTPRYDFGALCAYMIIMGDASSVALEHLSGWDHHDWSQRRTCMIVLTLVLILPAVLMRDISKLEKTSSFSVFTVVVVVAVVAGKYLTLPFVEYDGDPLSGTALTECAWRNPELPERLQATAMHLPDTYFSSSQSWTGPGLFNAFSIISFAFVSHDSAFLIFQVSPVSTNITSHID